MKASIKINVKNFYLMKSIIMTWQKKIGIKGKSPIKEYLRLF